MQMINLRRNDMIKHCARIGRAIEGFRILKRLHQKF